MHVVLNKWLLGEVWNHKPCYWFHLNEWEWRVTLLLCTNNFQHFNARSGCGLISATYEYIHCAWMRCRVLQSRQPNTQAKGSCHTHHLEVWSGKVCWQHTGHTVWRCLKCVLDDLCQARRNFLLVSHADCVASCLALMPHGRVVESVDYGASMLAWRTPLPALLTSPRLSALQFCTAAICMTICVNIGHVPAIVIYSV